MSEEEPLLIFQFSRGKNENKVQRQTSVDTDESFFKKLRKKAERAASILKIHPDVAIACLPHTNWNEDDLILQISENRQAFFEKIGITEDQCNEKQGLHKYPENGRLECDICSMSKLGKQMLALPCNHYFCNSCWRTHIETQMNSGNLFICCMNPQCKCPILITDIFSVCGKKIAQKYEERLSALSASLSYQVKRCSNPKCQLLIKSSQITKGKSVKCSCGYRTCFECGKMAHEPLGCSHVQEWLDKLEDLQANAVIISSTKQCPKCKSRIEKNGGCIHMHCANCQYDFCWNCGRQWETHPGDPYACEDKWMIKEPKPKQTPEAQLKETENFFALSYNSMEADRELMESSRNRLKERLTKQHIDKSEMKQMISTIEDLIIEGRSVLTWTHPYQLYITDPGAARIVNMWKNEVNVNLSKLTNMCDVIEPKYKNLVTVTNNLRAAIDALLKQTEGG